MLEEWKDFFFAQVGASAALTGLIFVGVSINLSKIIGIAPLVNRALQALVVLITILMVASLVLVPDQPLTLLGLEVLVISLIVGAMLLAFDLRTLTDITRPEAQQYQRALRFNSLMNQVATVFYVIGGVTMLSDNSSGVYWLVPAILFSFLKAITDAWILLIEINR
jgi:modulator of FtsH protease